MEIPRLGGGQIGATYNTVTAMPDSSRICDLYCSLQQHPILNPLIEARDRTHILMDTRKIEPEWEMRNFKSIFNIIFILLMEFCFGNLLCKVSSSGNCNFRLLGKS